MNRFKNLKMAGPENLSSKVYFIFKLLNLQIM